MQYKLLVSDFDNTLVPFGEPKPRPAVVKAVKKLQAERGEWLGGRPPYGYRKSETTENHLEPDPEAAEIVRQIFSLCAAGKGPSQIARILAD